MLRIYSYQLGLYILQHSLNIRSLSTMMNVVIDGFKIDCSGRKCVRVRWNSSSSSSLHTSFKRKEKSWITVGMSWNKYHLKGIIAMETVRPT